MLRRPSLTFVRLSGLFVSHGLRPTIIGAITPTVRASNGPMNASKAGTQLTTFRIGCSPSTRAALVMQSIDIDLLYYSFKRMSLVCLTICPCRSLASVAFPQEGGVISSTHHAALPLSLLTLGYSSFGRSVRSAKTYHEALGLAERTPDSSPSEPRCSKLLRFLHQIRKRRYGPSASPNASNAYFDFLSSLQRM